MNIERLKDMIVMQQQELTEAKRNPVDIAHYYSYTGALHAFDWVLKVLERDSDNKRS